MEKDILKQLKNLRQIQPNKEYASHSKMLILASKQNEPIKAFTLSDTALNIIRVASALSIAMFLVFSLMKSVFYINDTYSPLALEGLNQKSLAAEANEINNSISITLGDINYLAQSNTSAVKTLNAVAKVETKKQLLSATQNLKNSSTTASTTQNVSAYLINTNSTSTDPITNQLEKLSK